MQPANDFTSGAEAMKLVALDTLRAVLEDHFGTIDMSPLAMDIYEDFEAELEGRV